jgi:hypothetical protein
MGQHVCRIRKSEGTTAAMKVKGLFDDSVEPDLIDPIANALPESVRSDYYRELKAHIFHASIGFCLAGICQSNCPQP